MFAFSNSMIQILFGDGIRNDVCWLVIYFRCTENAHEGVVDMVDFVSCKFWIIASFVKFGSSVDNATRVDDIIWGV